jgi:cytochrome P450
MIGAVGERRDVAAPKIDDLTLVDPYPFYAAVRAERGLCWSPELGGWLVGRYDDIRAGLADQRFSAARLDQLLGLQLSQDESAMSAATRLNRRSMFFTDGEWQQDARRCVGRALHRRRLDALIEASREEARRLAATIVDQGHSNLLKDYALPLSVALIGEMMDLDAPTRAELRSLVEVLVGLFGGAGPPIDSAAVVLTVRRLEGLLEQLTEGPQHNADTIFGIVQSLVKERELTDDQLTGIAHDLVTGGYVPLTNLIGNTIACLLVHPDALAKVRRFPEMVGRAVAEAGRLEPPNQITSRVATETLEFAGARIEQGELVFFLLASGNRDPALCERPDTFDLDRNPNHPLTFGVGPHTCIGARLGSYLAECAVEELLSAAPHLELASPLSWSARTLRVRELVALDVCLAS